MKTNVSIKFNSIEEYREIEKKLIELGYKEHSKTLTDFMLEDLPNDLFATVLYRELKYCVFDFTQKDELVYNSLEEFLKDYGMEEKSKIFTVIEYSCGDFGDKGSFLCYIKAIDKHDAWIKIKYKYNLTEQDKSYYSFQ